MTNKEDNTEIKDNKDQELAETNNNAQFKKLYKKYKNLPQYRDLPEEQLVEKVNERLEELEDIPDVTDDMDVSSMFADRTEKREAKSLIKKYLRDYVIESVSDKNTLKQLIFLEVLHNRLQRELNEFKATNQPSPVKTIEALHSNLREITTLKMKLGLSKDKKDMSKDGLGSLELLKKKLKMWGEKNRGSRTMVCPHCGKMTLLKIRMDSYEAKKHPFFRDRILFNRALISLYQKGKLTKQDVADVLETSSDYTEWLVKKWGKFIESGELK